MIALVLLPPLISINRFQRRIATGISLSLGRPVHLDHVSLNLLPLPSLTVENLVVDEDPSFGSEPIIRSSSVTARLRVGSLWRRQIEFSRISFVDPSINLVRHPDGRWNVENVLLRAARFEAAPTGQRRAGAAPRFPYIEATGARLNLKLGREKMPFSLTEADFALWLSTPQQWRLRLKARPARTDRDASDTGSLQIEGTLGRPVRPGPVLIDVQGAWRNVPMGEASRVLLGRDAGLRGEMALTLNLSGSLAQTDLKADLHIDDLRRAEFVPEHALTIDLECLGQATHSFHTVEAIRCGGPSRGGDAAPALALTGTIADTRLPSTVSLQAGTSGIPASTLLQWMRVGSSRVTPDLTATGVLVGSIAHEALTSGTPAWTGQAVIRDLSLSSRHIMEVPVTFQDLVIEIHAPPIAEPLRLGSQIFASAPPALVVAPTEVSLGGKEPALLGGSVDASGIHLHLSGSVLLPRLVALGDALPLFGDGLAAALPDDDGTSPLHLDLTGDRPWGEPQVWTETVAGSVPAVRAAPTLPSHLRHPSGKTPSSRM